MAGFLPPNFLNQQFADAIYADTRYSFSYSSQPPQTISAIMPTSAIDARVSAIEQTTARLDERSQNAATSSQLSEAQRSIESKINDAVISIKESIAGMDARVSSAESRLAGVEANMGHMATKAWVAISALTVAAAIIAALWAVLRPTLAHLLR